MQRPGNEAPCACNHPLQKAFGMKGDDSRVRLGQTWFSQSDNMLTGPNGSQIALRPQSVEVLLELINHLGEIVDRNHLIETVWSELNVTDDSLIQCIADIRRAIGDKDHRIVQTIPKKGYRLVAEQAAIAQPAAPPKEPKETWSRRFTAIAALFTMVTVGVLGASSSVIQTSGQPTIAVLPFEDLTGNDRWKRLGRGLSIDIANELARNPEFGVIGSETTYDASTLETIEAGKKLNTTFVLDGDIQAEQDNLRIAARLLDVESGQVLWSEKWNRPLEDYLTIQDDIVSRANASLVAHFWFGALNRAVADKARKKPGPSLTAYEQYLLGVNSIVWTKADYGKALKHFYQAVEIEPSYARAWAMIGAMKLWIADVSKDDVREKLNEESRAAVRKAFLHEPHDAFVMHMMSTVHLAEGNVEAARRAVLSAVELSPNNPDILALASWQSMGVGITGTAPMEWGQKAIDLNPRGPPWHKLGLATAMFASEDYKATIAAMEDAPPHHKKFVFLAAAHMLLENNEKARVAVENLRKKFPEYTLTGDMNFPITPGIERLMKYAAMAGVPMGDTNNIAVRTSSSIGE